MPASVLRAVHEHLDLEAKIGGHEAADEAADRIRAGYEELAAAIGARPRNIAIVSNATAGFVQALSSFDLSQHSVIVTSRCDYTSNQIQYLSLHRRMGVELVHAEDLPEGGVDPGSVRAAIRGAVGRGRKPLVALSWIPTSSGLVQDAQAVGAICHEFGVPFVLDACQAVGQLPIDVERLHCDYLSTTARKFLRGPRGIGFLYVSDDALERGDCPLYVDMRGATWTSDSAFTPEPTARRYEGWELPYALVLGQSEAARYARTLGIERTSRRAWALAERLRVGLRALPGARVLDRGRTRCAIVTVAFERAPAARSRPLASPTRCQLRGLAAGMLALRLRREVGRCRHPPVAALLQHGGGDRRDARCHRRGATRGLSRAGLAGPSASGVGPKRRRASFEPAGPMVRNSARMARGEGNRMTGPSYSAARSLAGRLEDHFARHTAAGRSGESSSGPLPEASAIEALIDAGFWASLQREEGYHPEISLAYLPPSRAYRPLLFGAPLPLGARALARLAPAVERPGIHLGVWREGGELFVWGTTRAIPSLCFVLEVIGPGLMVVKHRTREDSPKFQNVAVFEGEQVKVLSPQSVDFSEHPDLLKSLVAPEAPGSPDDPVDVLLRLAVSMRAHRRGGTLVVVPADTEEWRRSIVQPISYAVAPAFTELADLVREAAEGGPARAQGDLGRAVDAVAGLTAVDGATLITDRFELLGFGVKIGRPEGRSRVERVTLSEPIEGGEAAVVAPAQLGGTRHISAAQLAQDQPDAVALVASQDGRFTIFTWASGDGAVHAHRVETLLL